MRARLRRLALRAGWAPAAVILFHAAVARLSADRQAFDPAMHFLGGAAIAYFLWHAADLWKEWLGGPAPAARGLIVFCAATTVAVFWEFAEFSSGALLGAYSQLSLKETMADLFRGCLGAASYLAFGSSSGAAVALHLFGGLCWGLLASGLILIAWIAVFAGFDPVMSAVPDRLISILVPLVVLLPGLAVAWLADWSAAVRIVRERESATPTLAQVMVLVGGLAAFLVVLPKVQPLLRSSTEGQTRGELGEVRARYQKDVKSFPKYAEIPAAQTPPYHASSAVSLGVKSNDAGGWMYDGAGGLWVNCTHTDSKQTNWESY